MINIVLLMAGNGSRFGNDGYKIKKPFLPVFYNNEILEMYKHVLLNVLNIFENSYGRIILIKKEEDIINLNELNFKIIIANLNPNKLIFTFKVETNDNRWSYAKLDSNNNVMFVVEKNK